MPAMHLNRRRADALRPHRAADDAGEAPAHHARLRKPRTVGVNRRYYRNRILPGSAGAPWRGSPAGTCGLGSPPSTPCPRRRTAAFRSFR